MDDVSAQLQNNELESCCDFELGQEEKTSNSEHEKYISSLDSIGGGVEIIHLLAAMDNGSNADKKKRKKRNQVIKWNAGLNYWATPTVTRLTDSTS